MRNKKKKIKSTITCLVLYYLCFVLWVQFPAAHSQLDDLYQGRVHSLAIVSGIHKHPSNTPFATFDNHSVTVLQIDKCIICTIYTSQYPSTHLDTGLYLCSALEQTSRSHDYLPAKQAGYSYRLRAPPAEHC